MIGFDGTLVVSVLLLKLSEVEEGHRVGIAVAYGILVGTDSFSCVVDASVALGHLPCSLSTFFLIVWLSAGIGFLVFGRGIIVFADGIELVALLDVRLRGTSSSEKGK